MIANITTKKLFGCQVACTLYEELEARGPVNPF